MIYTQSDSEIIYLITHIRKMSIKKDLRRHRFLIILIWLHLSNRYTSKDLPWLYEWCTRLETILTNDEV